MPAQQIDKNYDDIELIRKSLRSAQGGAQDGGHVTARIPSL